MKKVDMSEAAILRRLKTVDRLRELCLALMKAKQISEEQATFSSEKKGFDSKASSSAGTLQIENRPR
ncbi:MAG TPA: hypothetical protein PLD38_02250 [Pyrinomonadaceae bacterium]|nr:hypothetical protein [Chloracidobacterium sp.]MBP9935210.1 hypothetical protein [Pyrinomonadaceae bacterium]MBK7803064.1 hypothetical protein [Chloracidobacterium sp.]MBK9767702.1 hypothetical protein [Chloracidobacterium sp.]MBL0240829.1 hypothetical protein [Chloracidobacterium sp.]